MLYLTKRLTFNRAGRAQEWALVGIARGREATPDNMAAMSPKAWSVSARQERANS